MSIIFFDFQARIDSGSQTIVGVNKYRLEKEAPIDILEIDNTAVRQEQIENLKRLKEGRNQAEVDKALEAITECVKTGKGNLLELAVEAARVRATLGEISYACEKIVGRYKAVIRTISGVYSSESKNDSDFHRACELAEKFAKKEGRSYTSGKEFTIESPHVPLKLIIGFVELVPFLVVISTTPLAAFAP